MNIYCGFKKTAPKGKKIGTIRECEKKGQLRRYGRVKVFTKKEKAELLRRKKVKALESKMKQRTKSVKATIAKRKIQKKIAPLLKKELTKKKKEMLEKKKKKLIYGAFIEKGIRKRMRQKKAKASVKAKGSSIIKAGLQSQLKKIKATRKKRLAGERAKRQKSITPAKLAKVKRMRQPGIGKRLDNIVKIDRARSNIKKVLKTETKVARKELGELQKAKKTFKKKDPFGVSSIDKALEKRLNSAIKNKQNQINQTKKGLQRELSKLSKKSAVLKKQRNIVLNRIPQLEKDIKEYEKANKKFKKKGPFGIKTNIDIAMHAKMKLALKKSKAELRKLKKQI